MHVRVEIKKLRFNFKKCNYMFWDTQNEKIKTIMRQRQYFKRSVN